VDIPIHPQDSRVKNVVARDSGTCPKFSNLPSMSFPDLGQKTPCFGTSPESPGPNSDLVVMFAPGSRHAPGPGPRGWIAAESRPGLQRITVGHRLVAFGKNV
jgi:hypothetical protein